MLGKLLGSGQKGVKLFPNFNRHHLITHTYLGHFRVAPKPSFQTETS